MDGVKFLVALPCLMAALISPAVLEGLFGHSAGVSLIAGVLRLLLFGAATILILQGLRTAPTAPPAATKRQTTIYVALGTALAIAAFIVSLILRR